MKEWIWSIENKSNKILEAKLQNLTSKVQIFQNSKVLRERLFLLETEYCS